MKIHFSRLRYHKWAHEGHQKHGPCDASRLVWFLYINVSVTWAHLPLTSQRSCLCDLPYLAVQTHDDGLDASAGAVFRKSPISGLSILAVADWLLLYVQEGASQSPDPESPDTAPDRSELLYITTALRITWVVLRALFVHFVLIMKRKNDFLLNILTTNGVFLSCVYCSKLLRCPTTILLL